MSDEEPIHARSASIPMEAPGHWEDAQEVETVGSLDYAITLAFLAIGLVGGVESLHQTVWVGEPFAPFLWPFIASSGTVAVAIVVLLMRGLSRHVNRSRRADATPEEATLNVQIASRVGLPQQWRTLLQFSLASIVYVAALDYVGFVVSTLIFYFIGKGILARSRFLGLTLTAVITTVTLVAIFVVLVGASVPIGQGIFAELYAAIQEIRYNLL